MVMFFETDKIMKILATKKLIKNILCISNVKSAFFERVLTAPKQSFLVRSYYFPVTMDAESHNEYYGAEHHNEKK